MIHSPEIHHYVVGLKMGENVRWQNFRADWLEYLQVLLSYEVWPAVASGFYLSNYSNNHLLHLFSAFNFQSTFIYTLSNFIISSIIPSLAHTAGKNTFVSSGKDTKRSSNTVNTLGKNLSMMGP